MKKIISLIILSSLCLMFIGCENPKAEAFKRAGFYEVDTKTYEALLNFKSNKNATLPACYSEGIGSGGNYQHFFNFDLTDEQYNIALSAIKDRYQDDKIINNEYCYVMNMLKDFKKENDEIIRKNIKSQLGEK